MLISLRDVLHVEAGGVGRQNFVVNDDHSYWIETG
jgi:hypothetical protein